MKNKMFKNYPLIISDTFDLYKPEKTFCCFCKEKITSKSGITSGNKSEIKFRFMKKNERACLECYIDNEVAQSIKKQLKLCKK